MKRDSELDISEWNRVRFAVPMSEEVAAAALRAGWTPAALLAEAIADATKLGWTVSEDAAALIEGPVRMVQVDYRPVGLLETRVAWQKAHSKNVAMTALATATAREFMRRYGLDLD